MKILIEVVNDLPEDEVILRCRKVDETIQRIQALISEQGTADTRLTFYKQNSEFFFSVASILFFETEGDSIRAHTADDVFVAKYRLYELENLLPRYFVRASKSTIVNIRQVYSITRNLTASSLVNFNGSHKHIYVSRHYYQQLRQRLSERSGQQ